MPAMTFQKGQSGNPAGRPIGIKDRRTALRDALEGRADALLEKAVEKALDGDSALLVALLSRLIPKLKPESPALGSPIVADGTTGQAFGVISAALNGALSTSAAAELLQAISSAVRIREADELQARVERLEAEFYEKS